LKGNRSWSVEDIRTCRKWNRRRRNTSRGRLKKNRFIILLFINNSWNMKRRRRWTKRRDRRAT
jgi:hypothetical protein